MYGIQIFYMYFDLMNYLAYSLIFCIGHPWLVNHHDDVKIPLDMIIQKLVKAYIASSSLRKSALGVCNVILLCFRVYSFIGPYTKKTVFIGL